ncbi:MAG: PD40 domain-containing protein [Candidatus Eisenbacteria bacterium]|nr:PD40 domain-containing protein [Candidatus Eisenbacteria bacterium]
MSPAPSFAPRTFAALLTICLACALPYACAGQGMFGKNKVQYSDLAWHEADGRYVRLYFYAEEKELACAALPLADSMSAALADTFRHEPEKKIPLVLFSSQRDFLHSNVVPFLLPEEVAGLTEFAKGRVLVPYTGSDFRFRWVLRHELTHAFMMDKIASTLARRKKPLNYYPPTWLSEGLAEYMSASPPTPATEALLRDAVLSEQLVPLDEMWRLSGSIMVYREGQSLVTFIAERFGFSCIVAALDDWGSEKTFDALLAKHLGVSLTDLNDEWVRSLKQKYYPSVRERDRPSVYAREVDTGSSLSLAPVWVKYGAGRGGLAYMTARGETAELRVSDLGEPGEKARSRLLVRAGTSKAYESLHLFRSRMSVGPTGLLAFSAQKEERDVIHLLDSATGRRVSTIELPGLLALSSPAVSPDGGRLVVAGQDASGQCDLYLVRLADRSLVRLTNDFFDDRDPDWTADGKSVVFASDRCDTSGAGRYGIFSCAGRGGEVRRLTAGGCSNTEPRCSPSGKYVAFVSDRGGVPDLFLMDLREGSVARVTRSLAGVQMPCWGENDSTVFLVSLSSGKYVVGRVAVRPESLEWESGPGEARADSSRTEAVERAGQAQSSCEALEQSARRYRPTFGLDFARTTMGYDPEFVGGGSGQIALSDMLGNRHFLVYLSSQSEQGGDLLGSLSAGASYLDLAGRATYGLGVFSLGTVYDEELDILRQERRSGVLLYSAYPTSRFERVEANVVARYSDEYRYRSGAVGRTLLVSNYVSYVWDNTNLAGVGELVGSRVYLTLGVTRDVTRGVADYVVGLADLRGSVEVARNVILASRLEARSSFGEEGQRYYLGGPSTLRGYGTRTVSGKKVLLVNNELRLPLLARLAFRVPGGSLPFPTIRGALFFDAATCGDAGLGEWKGSLGVGFYLGGGYFPAVRFNIAWRTDFETVAREPVREFTVGWNY